MTVKSTLSVVTGTYNEESNIEIYYERLVSTLESLDIDGYEIIVADNMSTDNTQNVLRKLAAKNKRFKVILNSRNFGATRSGFNAFLQASGDAVILMSSDLQDPPEMIRIFHDEWINGSKVILAQKVSSDEGFGLFYIRKLYYKVLDALSSNTVEIPRNCTGFGLYDKAVVSEMKKLHDPAPYMPALIAEVGFKKTFVPFSQPKRLRGRSKHSLFTLYDLGINSIVNYSRLPIRINVFVGLFLMALSILLLISILIIARLTFWHKLIFVIQVFLLTLISYIIFSVGILGEYVVTTLVNVRRRPLSIVEEMINF